MTQYHRDQASDSEEVVTSFMQDGTYSSRNFATLGTLQPPFGLDDAAADLLCGRLMTFLTSRPTPRPDRDSSAADAVGYPDASSKQY